MHARVPTESVAPRNGLRRREALDDGEAVNWVTATVKDVGFGILAEVKVKATLKKEPDEVFTRYNILGACNPSSAYRALSEELDIGSLLPCKVTVYEEPGSGATLASAVDPEIPEEVTGRADRKAFADEVKTKLGKALNAI